jgi:DinB superfamily
MSETRQVDRSQDEPQRMRLEGLVSRVTDEQLAEPLGDGWTVSATLAHLAFWDRRAVVLINRWQRENRPPAPDDGIADVDVINEAALPMWRALAPRAAANEALAAAEAADQALDGAGSALIEQIVAAGSPFSPARANHRREHLDQIERALGG